MLYHSVKSCIFTNQISRLGQHILKKHFTKSSLKYVMMFILSITVNKCSIQVCTLTDKKVNYLYFLQTGVEVIRSQPGSFTHVNQLIKNMFVICVPFKSEILLDLTLYLVKHNSDITEAQELLTSKLAQKPFFASNLLRAYSGLFAYLSWKKCKLKFDKKDLDAEDLMAENTNDANLRRQMDFFGKKALILFGGLVEHCGVWDIFVTRQVEMLKYYDRADEAKRILVRYKQKNPENPNAHRLDNNCLFNI